MPKSKRMPPLPHATEQAIVFAFDGNPSSLSGKLRAIYEASAALMTRSEQEHQAAIKKAWGRDAAVMENHSLDQRVGRRKTFNNATKAGVLSEYEATLVCLGEITDAFKTLNALKHSVSDFTSLAHELHGFWSGRSAVSVQELDKLVPLFFSLQLHCWHLYAYLERPGPTFQARQARAQAGGSANNDGEEILREQMLEYLVKLPSDQQWKSLAKFLNEHRTQLEIILERYQVSRPMTPSGRPASACMALKIDNINRKLGEWAEDSSEFLNALQRLIPTYRRQ
ncbi:MAG: hypothetical protein KXJ61_17560 [Hydrogenophaga sp.]|jgi:hypothetical protein|nr:hypothetical protein [Hydrogenophaga sp.]